MHINTHTQSLTKTNRFRSGRVGKGSMVCSGGSSAFLQGHNMQKPQSTTHKLNKHDFWPGCQTLWLAASHKLNSHKLNKHDFWPGCQTLWLAASHKLNSHKLNKHDFWPGCQTLWLAASHKLNSHKLNKHDFWPGCQTLWLAASHKLNSHKLNKHDFWPGCQTLQLAASHNWLSRLAARPCGWQPASRSTIAQRTALFARTSHQNVRYFIMATDPTRFLSRRFNHCFSLTS